MKHPQSETRQNPAWRSKVAEKRWAFGTRSEVWLNSRSHIKEILQRALVLNAFIHGPSLLNKMGAVQFRVILGWRSSEEHIRILGQELEALFRCEIDLTLIEEADINICNRDPNWQVVL